MKHNIKNSLRFLSHEITNLCNEEKKTKPSTPMYLTTRPNHNQTNISKETLVEINQNVIHLRLHATCSCLRLDLGILQLQNQISTNLIILATMM
jgi:hypothetical protein